MLAWGISQGTKPSLQSLTYLFSGEPVLLLLGHHKGIAACRAFGVNKG